MDDESKCPDTPHGVQMETPYGKRRTCGECGRRWTKIFNTQSLGCRRPSLIGVPWVEERYSPLRDNLGEAGHGDG